jgi:rubrerythrin
MAEQMKGTNMSYKFNADEIFEMAEQIERNGSKFYREAAEKASDPESKRFLSELAAMEDDHEKIFADIRKTLVEAEKTATIFDPDDASALYLKALADTRVFYKKKTDFSSMHEILKEAIGAEKESIVFYLGIKEMVSESLGKGKIDTIIKEEMKHIQLLSKELVALNR